MKAKYFISALALIGTALGGSLIALGRYGDKLAEANGVKIRNFVVEYRSANEQTYRVWSPQPDYPEGSHITFEEAAAIVRSLREASCEARVIDVRTNETVRID